MLLERPYQSFHLAHLIHDAHQSQPICSVLFSYLIFGCQSPVASRRLPVVHSSCANPIHSTVLRAGLTQGEIPQRDNPTEITFCYPTGQAHGASASLSHGAGKAQCKLTENRV